MWLQSFNYKLKWLCCENVWIWLLRTGRVGIIKYQFLLGEIVLQNALGWIKDTNETS